MPIAVAVYRPEHYARPLAKAEDASDLEPTWQEWYTVYQETRQQMAALVGKPLALLLLQKHATVTICHSRTTNLAALTRQADALVAVAGHARMVTAGMVKPGAVVIDVGINTFHNGSMVGDLDFASVREVAGAVTPVPGGVGPLITVVLLKQCVQAAWQLASKHTDVKTAA